jgi:ATP-dependent DNA helicase DinG
MLTPTEILSEEGPIATFIDNFSVRLQQQQLAEEISEALNNHESLICEAGTGTGKTFAYLISAILSNKKIIISTGTKHLQDQLFYKENWGFNRACNASRKLNIAALYYFYSRKLFRKGM